MKPPQLYSAILPAAVIKTVPEDFEVEEIPAYMPAGAGEHLFLWVEKRDVSSGYLLSQLSRLLGVRERDIGIAGQKDRRAVTRQFVSVPANRAAHAVSSVSGNIRILSATSHTNKLRTGHVNGNRFRIVLRSQDGNEYTKSQSANVQTRLQELAVDGFPNYFGPQRFGHNGQSVIDGIAMLQNPSGGKPLRVKRHLRKLLASSVQASLFNQVLAKRVADRTFNTPLSGDVVCSRGGIRPFLFNQRGDTSAESLVPMGPMPGPRMLEAEAPINEMEQLALKELELSSETFSRNAKITPGTRRPFVEYPADVSAVSLPDGSIASCFTLPPGGYATVLLAEICDIISV